MTWESILPDVVYVILNSLLFCHSLLLLPGSSLILQPLKFDSPLGPVTL